MCLTRARPPPPILVLRHADKGGITLVPYAVEDHGQGVFWVKVYDPNAHNQLNRSVVIDTSANTWSYDTGGSLGIWSGDASSHTLGMVPISAYAALSACPFCASSPPTGQVWLSGGGHLRISDSQGRRIGYLGGQFVSEIPGATLTPVDGGMGLSPEPIYTLPLTATNTIQLDGQTLTQNQTATVTQFGPGYAVGVADVPVGPSASSQITVTADGNAVTYQPSITGTATLMLALDGTDASSHLRLSGIDVGAGQSVTLSANPAHTQLTFTGSPISGTYDLSVIRFSAAGTQIFWHAAISSAATDTQYVDYGAWDGNGPLSLRIDHGSDGSIDQTIALTNQVQRVYVPLMIR